jgi:hypothetical protein
MISQCNFISSLLSLTVDIKRDLKQKLHAVRWMDAANDLGTYVECSTCELVFLYGAQK